MQPSFLGAIRVVCVSGVVSQSLWSKNSPLLAHSTGAHERLGLVLNAQAALEETDEEGLVSYPSRSVPLYRRLQAAAWNPD